MPDWLLILVGLVALVVSADCLVRGSQAIALALGLRPLIVGLTVVAFGTSAPEFAAALAGALGDAPGIATGTVFGSNIANIGLILGITALFSPITPSDTPRFEAGFLLLLTAITPLPMWIWGEVPRWFGLALIAFLVGFTRLLIWRERQRAPQRRTANTPQFQPFSVVLVLVGLAGLTLGADWLVTGGKGIALAAGVDPVIVGIGVGVATSLPEFAASLAAAAKGHPEIALGNVLGSNLFNIGMVLGGTAAVTPLPMTTAKEGLHVFVGLGFCVLLLVMLLSSPRLSRAHGALLLAGYAAYMTIIALRA